MAIVLVLVTHSLGFKTITIRYYLSVATLTDGVNHIASNEGAARSANAVVDALHDALCRCLELGLGYVAHVGATGGKTGSVSDALNELKWQRIIWVSEECHVKETD